MPWSVYNSNGKLLQSLAITDDSIVEGKLDVSNAPTNGYFLQAQSGEGGGLTWATAGGDLSFGGDTFGADKVIGSNDAYALSFETAGVVRMRIEGAAGSYHAAGAITMPTQPLVIAYNSAQDVNVTGNGATATVDFDTELADQNADFASDTFTAPVTGPYMVQVAINATGFTDGNRPREIRIQTSNRTWGSNELNDASGEYVTAMSAALVDMDAGDTFTVTFRVRNESSNVIDIEGTSTSPYTWLSVRLV